MSLRLKFILFFLLILVLSYLENTYILNLVDPEYSFLVERFNNPDIVQLSAPGSGVSSSLVRLSSILLYAILFFLINLGWVKLWPGQFFRNVHILGFWSLAAISILMLGLYRWIQWEQFYLMSRIIKDFLLSPVYTIVLLIGKGIVIYE